MEMDEMELDRYVTGLMDTERRNLRRDVRAGKKPKRNEQSESEREGEDQK